MQLRYTILYVDDVEASLAFYEAAFGLERAMLHESGDYGELATGGTKLAFSSVELTRKLGEEPASTDPERPTFEIAFETDDVGQLHRRTAVRVGHEQHVTAAVRWDDHPAPCRRLGG